MFIFREVKSQIGNVKINRPKAAIGGLFRGVEEHERGKALSALGLN